MYIRSLLSAITLVLLGIYFTACDGSSNGDLLLSGTIVSDSSDRSFRAGGVTDAFSLDNDAIAGVSVSALGKTATTNVNGQFYIYGDPATVPSQIEVTLNFSNSFQRNNTKIYVDNTGETPIVVRITRRDDGSVIFVLEGGNTPETGGSALPSASPTPSAAASASPTVEASPEATAEATAEPSAVEGVTCDPVKGIDDVNPDCFSDSPYCVNSRCVQCRDTTDCEIGSGCENGFCEVPTDTCSDEEKICSNGSSTICINSCQCDDGFLIGNCNSICFDTGSAPSQCSSSGLGCSDGSDPVCPF